MILYRLTKVRVYPDDEFWSCVEIGLGFFDSLAAVKKFISEIAPENRGFFIVSTYLLNPRDIYQTDTLQEMVLDKSGNILCQDEAMHFVAFKHEMHSEESVYFKGRDVTNFEIGDFAWYYDRSEKRLVRCKVDILPPSKSLVSGYLENLYYWDDNFLVSQLGSTRVENVPSIFMFTEEFVKGL